MESRKIIMGEEAAQQKLHRMALEIAEKLSGDDAQIVFIGVQNSGEVIAATVASFLKEYMQNEVKVISVMLDKDVPEEVKLSENINLDDKNIIIVDDVCNRGQTLLYALKPLLEFHPRRIQTLVMVERMYKNFPVKPDYVGLSIATTAQDFVRVETKDGKVIGAFVE